VTRLSKLHLKAQDSVHAATAVVEGVGDHACEYMTGGRVVVLGPTGRNFGAGMSGGVAYVHDPEGRLAGVYNSEMVDLEPLSPTDRAWLRDRIALHHEETGSAVAREILADWVSASDQFVTVMPRDYRRVLEATEVCIADELAGAADLVMGKDRGIPAAVVRGVDPRWLRTASVAAEIIRPPGEDLFR